MNTRFQLSLIVTTLILTTGILLFGWVYLASLNNKYESILKSPLNTEAKLSILEEENRALAERLTTLEQGRTSSDQMNNVSNEQASLTSQDPSKLIPGGEIPSDQANKSDVYIDQRCVADTDKLDECTILATIPLTNTINLLVKPSGALKADQVNELIFELQDSGKKYTTLHTTTANILNVTEPIATIVLTGKNDVTIQTRIGINNILSTYTFDGEGWIDYSKFSQQ